jgi:hypothetical protein
MMIFTSGLTDRTETMICAIIDFSGNAETITDIFLASFHDLGGKVCFDLTHLAPEGRIFKQFVHFRGYCFKHTKETGI